MVERGKAPPKPGIPNPSRGGNRILEAELATGNNGNQGKCLGTKPGAVDIGVLAVLSRTGRFQPTGTVHLERWKGVAVWDRRPE